MTRKIFTIILTVVIPFIVYFGLVGIGKISKSFAHSTYPDVAEGFAAVVIIGLGIFLTGLCMWGCYRLANFIVEKISDIGIGRHEIETWDDWPESIASTPPHVPPVNEDQAYRQRIGVEEEEEDHETENF